MLQQQERKGRLNPFTEVHTPCAEEQKSYRLIAYIIGPYRDKRGISFVDANIQRARVLAKMLWNHGYTVICPQANSAFFDGCTENKAFLDGDLQLLAFADVAFVVPEAPVCTTVKESTGSQAELAFCQEHSIPVVHVHLETGGVIVLPEAWRYGDERRPRQD